MELIDLKDYIYDNNLVETILEELGFHHITYHNNARNKNDGYWSCAFPDGNNKNGLLVYNNPYLKILANTRTITNPYNVPSSLIDVVCFVKNFYLSIAIKWCCDTLGLNYYKNPNEELPLSIQWTNMIYDMDNNESIENDVEKPLKPLDEIYLTYYKPYSNKLFKNDGISYLVQQEFEIGYDLSTNRITIPIRDELGTLVGVKGRWFDKICPEYIDKYISIESYSKTRILYGLYKTYPFIKEENKVIVFESEKSVLLAWTYGIYNTVAIGGHDLSSCQVKKLTALGVNEIIICYDEDVFREDKTNKLNLDLYTNECNKFIPQQKVSIMADINGDILNKKESPIDDINKYNKLYNERFLVR